MMYKKFIQLLGMALILLAVAACSREAVPATDGEVTISFRVGDVDTKAVSPGDGNVADGGGIYCHRAAGPPVVLTPDLYIFICDWETGALVKRYPGDADDDGNEDGNVDPDSDWADSKSTFLSVTFDFDVEGTYSVYALANVSGGDSNLTLPSASALTAITNASQLEALLISLSDPTPNVGSRMPLSAKGSLNVVKGLVGGKYNGHVELQMLRCFNKVQLSFKNLTGSELNLYNCQITFKDLNVQQGWLFPTSPDFVATGEDENSDGKDDNYRNYTSAIADVTGIAHEAERSFFANPVVFLPSVAPTQTKPSKGQRYLVDISFRIPKEEQTYNAGNSATYYEKSFTNLPIHTPKSLDIKSLGRNQYLQVLTTVSKGLDVSFNFRVKEWEEHTEYVTFD
jgi:hypothetical protein